MKAFKNSLMGGAIALGLIVLLSGCVTTRSGETPIAPDYDNIFTSCIADAREKITAAQALNAKELQCMDYMITDWMVWSGI